VSSQIGLIKLEQKREDGRGKRHHRQDEFGRKLGDTAGDLTQSSDSDFYY
jgi:hypothetical protein